jgi:hypothetical protein
MKTIVDIYQSVPAIGTFGFPEVMIIQGDTFKIGLSDEENDMDQLGRIVKLFKSEVLKNLDF